MTNREESKLNYSVQLREDLKEARKCIKGKSCGGRCIPANWNCRLKGEGDTPPTRGNLATLSPELKNRIESRRRNENLSTIAKLALTAGGAAAAGVILNKRGVSPREVTQGAATAAGLVSAFNPAISGPVTLAAVAAGAGAGLSNASSKAEKFKAQVAGVAASAVKTRKIIARRRGELAADRKAFNELQDKIQNATDDKQKRQLIKLSKARLKLIENNERKIKALSESVPGRERLVLRARNRSQITFGKIVRAATKGANETTKQARSIRSQSIKNRSAFGLTSLGKPGAKVQFSDWRANPRNTEDSVSENQRDDVVFTNKELHARVKAEAERTDKPCGNSYIPENAKCSKVAGSAKAQSKAPSKPPEFSKGFVEKHKKYGGYSPAFFKSLNKAERGELEAHNKYAESKQGKRERKIKTAVGLASGVAKTAAVTAAGGYATAKALQALYKLAGKKQPIRRKSGFQDPKRSEYVKEQLARMRAKGTGKYGAKGKRSFTSEQKPFYSEADRIYPVKHKRLFRDEETQRDDVVFTNKELHARVKAEAKRKFKVYPSAYANAWMVKEYKKRGGGFRNDDLKKWFNEKWVRMSAKGEILGECGDRGKGEGKPRCLPLAKARALSKKERASTVKAKRRKDPKKNRSGAAKMVPNTFDSEGKKYSKTVVNRETGRKRTVKYGAKGYRIAPGTDKGDRYCARSFGDMKSHNKNCAGKDRNTPLCLSRAKWKCSGKKSR